MLAQGMTLEAAPWAWMLTRRWRGAGAWCASVARALCQPGGSLGDRAGRARVGERSSARSGGAARAWCSGTSSECFAWCAPAACVHRAHYEDLERRREERRSSGSGRSGVRRPGFRVMDGGGSARPGRDRKDASRRGEDAEYGRRDPRRRRGLRWASAGRGLARICPSRAGCTTPWMRSRTLQCDCVQVFTKNQRQWKSKPLSERRHGLEGGIERLGWERRHRQWSSHNSYLVNMASPDPEGWEKSVTLQRDELERCEALGIPACVAHPGAHLESKRKPGEPNPIGVPPSADEEKGLGQDRGRAGSARTGDPGVRGSDGAGEHGGKRDQSRVRPGTPRWIRDRVKAPERVGFCFDTCHAVAAGHDMSTKDRGAKPCSPDRRDVRARSGARGPSQRLDR